jgi:membrane protein DedA with SNARE-associated domain
MTIVPGLIVTIPLCFLRSMHKLSSAGMLALGILALYLANGIYYLICAVDITSFIQREKYFL